MLRIGTDQAEQHHHRERVARGADQQRIRPDRGERRHCICTQPRCPVDERRRDLHHRAHHPAQDDGVDEDREERPAERPGDDQCATEQGVVAR